MSLHTSPAARVWNEQSFFFYFRTNNPNNILDVTEKKMEYDFENKSQKKKYQNDKF